MKTIATGNFFGDKDRTLQLPPPRVPRTAYRPPNALCSAWTAKANKRTWRKVPRDVNEEARDLARALMKTPEYERSRDERKRVEMRFAHLKTHHRFERMRLRGLSGARDEFHLAATAQNLKTLANHIGRPPPGEPAAPAA